jgi:hypothetical protein
MAAWTGWAPLRRRLRLLQQDAAQVALCHGPIDAALGRGTGNLVVPRHHNS